MSSPPQIGRRGQADHPAPAANQGTATKQVHTNHDTTVRVPAAAYGPSARRTMTVNVVARCPYCGGSHVHRGNGGLRRAGCGRGEYVIIPRVVLTRPAAVVA